MTVKFYSSFSKRLNSTLQPSGSGTDHDCKLKANCSEHDPVLILSTNTFTYTYAYISDWGKYYFVRDVVSLANNLVEYHLVEDVLATYKSDVGAVTSQIAYSSSHYDTMIIDSRIQVKNQKTQTASTDDSPVFSGGGYILTVFNGDPTSNSSGASVSYYLDETAMTVVRKWLADDNFWNQIVSYFNGHSPLDAMFGLVWVPYGRPSGSSETDQIYVGNKNNQDYGYYFTVGHKPYILSGFPIVYGTRKMQIHLRYSDFRMFEPFTTGTVFLPGVGNVDLNMGDWKGSTYINVSFAIEVITGNVKYLLFHDNGNMIQSFDCCVAAQCPLGQVTMNASGVMTGLGTLIGGVATLATAVVTEGASLAVAGAAAMVAGAANTAMSANQHGISISGGFGGRTVQLWPYVNHVEYSVDTENPDAASYIAQKGRPCGAVKTISTLTGYVCCLGASVAGSMNAKEKEEINAFLNSGFYYE